MQKNTKTSHEKASKHGQRPHGHQEGDWQSCLVSHLQLSRLGMEGYLPLADLVSVRAGLASIGNDVLAENFPNPNKEERVCLIPFLLRGLGFPIHPFLWGLLAFYGIQLHNLTPGLILHISGFFSHCKLFLGCRPILNYGESSFASSPAIEGALYLKWVTSKYGV